MKLYFQLMFHANAVLAVINIVSFLSSFYINFFLFTVVNIFCAFLCVKNLRKYYEDPSRDN